MPNEAQGLIHPEGMGDIVKLRGSIQVYIKDLLGQPVAERRIDNVVVRVGRQWVLQQINSSQIQAGQSIGFMAIGTSTTAPSTADSALGAENSRLAINNFTTSNLTSNPPSWRAEASWNTNQANTTLGEVAMFNSSTGGTMLARATFATINKTTSNTLSVSYTISG